MQTTMISLENGLHVILVDTKSFPSLTTLVMVGAGSRYETLKNNGIAHFFEHMAFKGTKKYPNSFVISSTIEGFGGIFNAFTSKDHTGYWVKAPAEHFEKVIDVLSDMILHPLLVPEEIEREKGVIVEEINMYEDMPSRKVSDIFDTLMYDGNPLSYDIAGTPETVRSFDRKTFTEYITTHYHPGNAVVIIAGGFEGKPASYYIDQVKEKFAKWTPKQKTGFEKYSDSQSKIQKKVFYKKTEQAHFCLGFKAFPFTDKSRYPLSILSAILGGGMSSRLFIEVRERRGLCYYISTGRELFADTGYLVTQAGVTNSKDKVNEAVKVTLEEHLKIAKGDVSNDELQRAKELIKGRLLLSLEDSYDVASFVGTRYLLEKSMVDPQEVVKALDAVTKEEVIDLAKRLFVPSRLNFALIGPFKDKDIQIDFT